MLGGIPRKARPRDGLFCRVRWTRNPQALVAHALDGVSHNFGCSVEVLSIATDELAHKSMALAMAKLPVRTRIVKREEI